MLNGKWRESGWSTANPGAVHSMPVRSQAPAAAPPPNIVVAAVTPSLDARAQLPTKSPSDVEGNLAAFVVRPEIGLWAVVAPNGDTPVNATRTVADALQDLGPAATLTLLAESVRQILLRVSQRLADESARNPSKPVGLANVLAVVKTETECAFISAGDAQVLRVRDGITLPMIGEKSAAHANGSDLIALVAAGPAGSSDPCGSSDLDHVPVVYDHAAAGDVWLLGGSRDASDAATAAFCSGEDSQVSMERVVREFAAATGGRPPPLMMVEIGR